MDNYPDTTWAGDPRAPWNKPEYWEGHTCGECKDFYPIPSDMGDCGCGFCRELCEYMRSTDEAYDCFELE